MMLQFKTDHDMDPVGRGFRVYMPSGIYFYPEDPHFEEFDIKDVAHKLAFICRYGGATKVYYSVAEHCVILSHLIPGDKRTKRTALIHDVAEFALQDIMRPLKQKCRPWYDELERKIEIQASIAFHVDLPVSDEILEYDLRICMNEKSHLLNTPLDYMNELEKSHGPLDNVVIKGWNPYEARDRFLERWAELKP